MAFNVGYKLREEVKESHEETHEEMDELLPTKLVSTDTEGREAIV